MHSIPARSVLSIGETMGTETAVFKDGFGWRKEKADPHQAHWDDIYDRRIHIRMTCICLLKKHEGRGSDDPALSYGGGMKAP